MRLRAAVQSAPYPLMLHASDGEILQLSEAWMTLTGYYSTPVTTTGEWAKLAFPDQSDVSILPPRLEALDQPEGESMHLGEHAVQGGQWTRSRSGISIASRSAPCPTAADSGSRRRSTSPSTSSWWTSERAARRRRRKPTRPRASSWRQCRTSCALRSTPSPATPELLKLGLRGPITREQREDLERIDRSQRHLLSLINDVLNFAKIEAGHVAVDIEPMPTGPRASRACANSSSRSFARRD